ncbi:MAG: YHYH protein [Candidatus Poseidoniia archaeon]|nr:YHYH protein [Candidatus Poseidoniia archaeon]
MLESVILVNLALCFLFGTILFNRKYDLSKVYGVESKSLGIAFLLLMAFTLNMMPLVSAADSDGDGVDDADDDCPDTVDQDDWSIANNGCSYPSYMDDVWQCIDGGVMVQDLTGNDDEECSVTLSYDATYMTVTTPGIANHDMEGGPGGEINSQDYSWKLPLVPVDDDDCNPDVSTDGCDMAPDRGPVAVAVNGVPFYGPEDGPGGDAVASHIGIYEEDRQQIELGVCGAHSGPGGSYHYHYDGNCMHWHGDNSNENHDVSITDDKDFLPEDLTINVGDTVVWTNNDDSPHTVTADDDEFNSGNLAEGATWSYTFTEAGTYDYHCNYHSSMTGSVTVVDPEIVWTDYDFSKVDSTVASLIIGFAFDGYPIYGAYGTIDGEVTLMRSNYVLKDGETGYNGIDDYVYNADNGGHLDACNGVFSATPEFPDGIYHYHSTMPVEGNNPSANNAFPYFINCYAGIAEDSNFDGGALEGGGDGGGPMTGPPDADGDNVGDGWDMCDDTGDTSYPDGSPIYPRGCTQEQFDLLSSDNQDAAKVAYAGDDPPAPPDADGDGIPDPEDDCANTEAGKLVYFDGCAHETEENGGEDNGNTTANETEEAPDSDSDGISDDDDACPDENASGHDADADGCIDDSDNDGVKNDVDVCPFDPSDECQLAPEEEIFPEDVPGCVHESAENYNSDATEDDGSCKYESDSPGFGFALAALGCLIITFRRKL